MSNAPNFGSSAAMCVNSHGEWDIDPTGRMATGRDVLSQRLVSRQSTPLGSVIDSPNDCFDISDWLSANMTDGQIAQLPAQIQTELLKDQEVLSVTVQVTYTPGNSTLRVVENIVSAYGPFSLTLTVTPGNVRTLVGQIVGPTQGGG
jgi:hypothetical protein